MITQNRFQSRLTMFFSHNYKRIVNIENRWETKFENEKKIGKSPSEIQLKWTTKNTAKFPINFNNSRNRNDFPAKQKTMWWKRRKFERKKQSKIHEVVKKLCYQDWTTSSNFEESTELNEVSLSWSSNTIRFRSLQTHTPNRNAFRFLCDSVKSERRITFGTNWIVFDGSKHD